MNSDERLDQLTAWIRQFEGFADARPLPASGDASFRRYFRVQGNGSFILMDAPPPQEDCRPFVDIAGYLASMGLNSPRVIEADLDRGFLLLTDLGSVQYLEELKSNPDGAERLYTDALDALLVLFHDWLCEKHLGITFSESDEQHWQQCCDLLVTSALDQKRVFVHRDYHSRNLMVTESENPGVLDFQDAVEGPLTYDLVSLLKDCYVKWPADKIYERVMYFYDRLPRDHDLDEAAFISRFDLMGVQRHLKAAGIFARLLHRDGKSGYLKDVPRTLTYIVDIASKYEQLGFLEKLITTRVLPPLKEAGQ
jgi:aminoglycoside/choline kinase family phosphotransferase